MKNPHIHNWVLLLLLTVMWGSAFMFTKIAVSALPPSVVVAGRLAIAAIVLTGLLFTYGRAFTRSRQLWVYLTVIALVGNVLPFSLISWGQQSIDSSVAGILMAMMPLATLVLAHFFLEGERLTRHRVLGFLLGFSGVLVLTGPSALLRTSHDSNQLVAMLAVLAGALCYGASAVISRLRPRSSATESAVGTTLIAALFMLMAAPWYLGESSLESSPDAVGAAAVLGLFSTALPAIVYFRLIESAGPNFVSYLNYLIPLWAVLLGMLFLGEQPGVNDLLALALILSGIAIAQAENNRRVRIKRASQRP